MMNLVLKVAKDIEKQGGTTYFVGGMVRDLLLGKEPKDIDLEIHNITEQNLKIILSKYGKVNEFGKSFGIYQIEGVDVDFALPRTERKVGDKHTSFDVTTNPFLGTKKAAERRDLTVNSIMQDVLTGEIVDHFNGQEDINNKILRHVNTKTFIEDSLRVVRIATFASRFNFDIAEDTIQLAKSMDLSNLPKDRIMKELDKVLSKANDVSLFFKALEKMDKLSPFFNEMNELPKQKRDKLYNTLSTMKGQELTTMLGIICYYLLLENKDIEVFLQRFNNINKVEKTVIKVVNRIIEIENSISRQRLIYGDIPYNKLVLGLTREEVKTLNCIISSIWNPCFVKFINKAYKFMSVPFVNSEDLFNLGYKPNPKFGELLKQSLVLQAKGLSKEDILKKIVFN